MTLYDINKEMEAILNGSIDEETGELMIDTDRLEQLAMDRQEKLEHCAAAYKNYMAEAAAIKTEVDALNKRIARLKTRAESAARFLDMNLEQGETIESSRVSVAKKASKTTEVAEGFVAWAKVNAPALLRFKEPEPDKTKIKKEIQSGSEIPFCKIEEKYTIKIV